MTDKDSAETASDIAPRKPGPQCPVFAAIFEAAGEINAAGVLDLYMTGAFHHEGPDEPGAQRARALVCADFAARVLAPMVAEDFNWALSVESLRACPRITSSDAARGAVELVSKASAASTLPIYCIGLGRHSSPADERAGVGAIDMAARAVAAASLGTDKADREAGAWTARAIVYAHTIDEVREPLWAAVVELLQELMIARGLL